MPARELYTSTWFKKARTFVESKEQPWLILSAKYHLVCPETVIQPYEKTLKSIPKIERKSWAQNVFTQFEPYISDVNSITFLAGKLYWEFLEPALIERGVKVYVPMSGLRIGEQLSWLERNTNV